MKDHNIVVRIVHSESKPAWNIVGRKLGGKYKIARVPLITKMRHTNTPNLLSFSSIEWADNDNWIVHQTGWIIKENDDYILLASRYDEPNENRSRQLSGLFKIPKPWILYRHKLVFEK